MITKQVLYDGHIFPSVCHRYGVGHILWACVIWLCKLVVNWGLAPTAVDLALHDNRLSTEFTKYEEALMTVLEVLSTSLPSTSCNPILKQCSATMWLFGI